MNNLYAEIINKDNLMLSAKCVKQKGCTAVGVDNIPCNTADIYLQEHIKEVTGLLQKGKYRPKPIKRVAIEKYGGGIRYIGIPTVLDKIIQLSITNRLSIIYEEIFHPYSFGFRKDRNILNAVTQAKEHLNNGYIHIIQIDLKSFFDTINHDKMMSELYKKIKDKQLLHLIRLYLQSEIIYQGKSMGRSTKGLIQGGNLSPLLANVYLNPLDWELSRQGLRFVRYADDITIFCNSKQSAAAIKEKICKFIKRKMLLEVNTDKTVVTTPTECNLLGFQFYKEQEEYKTCIPKKAIEKLKSRIRENICKAKNLGTAKQMINEEITGWYEHYKKADRFLSNREIKSIDTRIIESFYKSFGKKQNIKAFKKELWNDDKILFIKKTRELSDN